MADTVAAPAPAAAAPSSAAGKVTEDLSRPRVFDETDRFISSVFHSPLRLTIMPRIPGSRVQHMVVSGPKSIVWRQLQRMAEFGSKHHVLFVIVFDELHGQYILRAEMPLNDKEPPEGTTVDAFPASSRISAEQFIATCPNHKTIVYPLVAAAGMLDRPSLERPIKSDVSEYTRPEYAKVALELQYRRVSVPALVAMCRLQRQYIRTVTVDLSRPSCVGVDITVTRNARLLVSSTGSASASERGSAAVTRRKRSANDASSSEDEGEGGDEDGGAAEGGE